MSVCRCLNPNLCDDSSHPGSRRYSPPSASPSSFSETLQYPFLPNLLLMYLLYNLSNYVMFTARDISVPREWFLRRWKNLGRGVYGM
jgi:hypothetical protein